MFEYPIINYLPQFILAALWFFPGLILGVIYGWRIHVTFLMAQDGSLEEEGFQKPISFLVKKHTTTPAAEEPMAPMTDAIAKIKASMETATKEETHKPGEFFW